MRIYGTNVDLPVELPDLMDGACCIGAITRGPSGCTCWEPVYDREQATKLNEGVWSTIRPDGPCGDCAFRGASPERRGDDRYHAAGQLDEIARGEIPFRCHEGMRRMVAIRHRPTGHVIELTGVDHYNPPTTWRPYQANGEPAMICAGWSAAHARHCIEETKCVLRDLKPPPPPDFTEVTAPCPPPSD